MKLRLVTGALVAAAALAVPAVAHAATYAPFEQADPAGDVQTGPSNRGIIQYPEIDMTNVRGARSSVQHSVAIKYVNLTKTPYTRYIVVLQQPNSMRTRVLEVRVGGGGKVNTALYSTNGENGIKQIRCTGARIVPDFDKDKITAVFPQSCFINTFPQGVYIYAQTGEWTESTWTNGPLTSESIQDQPDASDNFYGIWDYTDGAVQPKFNSKDKAPRLF